MQPVVVDIVSSIERLPHFLRDKDAWDGEHGEEHGEEHDEHSCEREEEHPLRVLQSGPTTRKE